ncbi:hypothetical protein XELAEV_18010585mg [Xenopus laevis]|uniref:Paraneoplastic antigen Ma-like C-terminal domain-containing protein n=1 Tax=Xenopus laevis TaxID=8355 RepID=A0A974DUS5_XENLA|nr:hypothetical protein XELAEV_18010585mg [Xenopus laevis]
MILDGEHFFYHSRVATSWRGSARFLLNVLIESPRDIDHERVPPDIDAEVNVLLNKKLFDLPVEKCQVKQCPSRESMVSKESPHNTGGWLYTPEIVSSMGQLTQLSWNGYFKTLKVFSGTDPVTVSEKSSDSLRDSTFVSLTDWTAPEASIRRKIFENLCIGVVKSYLVGHPNATLDDLIEVLEVTFGPVEYTTEMLYHFHTIFQKEKEDLSVYLVRQEQGLRLLVSHGAITRDEMDSLSFLQLRTPMFKGLE